VRHVRGIALVMVLFLTALISILLAITNLSAKRQVEIASKLLARAEVDFALRTAESKTLFLFLTSRWSSDGLVLSERETDRVQWNFFGAPFEWDSVTLRVQDASGLIAVPQRPNDFRQFEMILNEIISDRVRVADMMRRLATRNQQYTSGDSQRMLPLQSTYELIALLGLSPEEFRALDEVVTVYPVADFNPATASDLAIRARFGYPDGDFVSALREQGQLDESSFGRLTGLAGDEFIRFFPGPGFRMDLTVEVGGLLRSSRSMVGVYPYGSQPVIWWSRRSRDADFLRVP
jgi:type II secretory pathway component PulK